MNDKVRGIAVVVLAPLGMALGGFSIYALCRSWQWDWWYIALMVVSVFLVIMAEIILGIYIAIGISMIRGKE